MRLYAASFSFVQLVSTLSRAKIGDAEIREELRRLLARHDVANLAETDLSGALAIRGNDLEDVIQYTVCRKVKCPVLLTDNAKDFRPFAEIRVVAPAQIRTILF